MQYAKSTGGSIFSPVIQDRVVPGYYTSTTVDTQGHIINKSAMIAALEDYRQWGGIREMHSNPIGVIESIGDPYWNAIKARVVNTPRGDEVLQYVREGVYKAFSIGALVTDGRMIPFKEVNESLFVDVPTGIVRSIKELGYILEITELVLVEVSIVDRPANPVARISEVKGFSGVDAELPSLVSQSGYDVLKGMFPVANDKFFVNWDGGEGTEKEMALDTDTEETQEMTEDTEVVDGSEVVSVESEATEVAETEVVVSDVTGDGDETNIELSIDTELVVEAEEGDVVRVDIEKSLERVENMIVALSDSIAKSIEALRAEIAAAETKSAEVVVEKSAPVIGDDVIEMITSRVQEKMVVQRKGVVQTVAETEIAPEQPAKTLKALDIQELRNRIVTTLAQSSK